MSWQQVLVCQAHGPDDDRPDHFRLAVDRALAEWLLKLRHARQVAATYLGRESPVSCLEVSAYHGTWGRVPGYYLGDNGDDSPWHAVPADTPITPTSESVDLNTVKATSRGVSFSAAWKNDDFGRYFETPEPTWDQVVALCGHRGDDPPAGIVPAAEIAPEGDG